MLESLLSTLADADGGKGDWADELTPSQKKRIEMSLEQLDAGNGIPHEEARKTYSNLKS